MAAAPEAQRKALQEELELVRHRMGPYDANGVRVRCQAMWHDAQIEALAADIKRLVLVHDSAPTPANDLRLSTRHVAAKCLEQGWAMPSGRASSRSTPSGPTWPTTPPRSMNSSIGSRPG